MDIGFFGGAKTVTGSKFLVHENGTRILLDCGLFQGPKSLRLLNREPFPFAAKDINAVVLTHAHLDHCGALPLLVKAGFKGPIYCTPPTCELAKIILLDAAKIQEEEAEYANRKKFSKHSPALPLFDTSDVESVFPLFKTVEPHQSKPIGSLRFEFYLSGHILGAASVLLSGSKTVFFSGDLGRWNDPLMWPPENLPKCDILLMESTYGGKIHDRISSKTVLADCINAISKKNGVLLIPSFSVGRAQNLIQEISELKSENQISPSIPVYFNSPMGLEASKLYEQFYNFTKAPEGSFSSVRRGVKEIQNAQQSIVLNETKSRPLIIIAASGMLTGGRVLHHVRAFAGSFENMILLPGFQALGTRGRDLLEGKKQIKIHGAYRDINCRIVAADSFSAHADQQELLNWIKAAPQKPQKIFLVHGEPGAQEALKEKIEDEIGIETEVAQPNQIFNCSR